MADKSRTIEIDGHCVELGNEDKVIFPGDRITKGDLIAHYREVASVMLPHAKGRALTLHRFPDGIGKEGFYQQQRPDYFPSWVGSLRVARAGGGSIEHTICENGAAIVYLANQAAITLHGWLSRAGAVDRPDRLIFDLDPPGDDVSAVVQGARRVRALMEELGLTAFVMSTGSRGLHVVAPLDAGSGFDEVRQFAQAAARALANRHPDDLTVEQRKDKRGRRLYLDVMRNSRGQTAVLPYCTRALPGAPVATPLDWGELNARRFDARRYHLRNIARRLGNKADPWARIDQSARSLGPARRALDALGSGD